MSATSGFPLREDEIHFVVAAGRLRHHPLTEHGKQCLVSSMGRTDGLAQLLQHRIKSLVDEVTLALVDIDQADMLAAIRAGDGNAERVEGTTTLGSAPRVERYKALKGGDLPRRLMAEPRQVVVVPLCRRFPGHDGGDGVDPVSVRIHPVISQSQDKRTYRGVENLVLEGGCLTGNREAVGLCTCIEEKLEELGEKSVMTSSELLQCGADALGVFAGLRVCFRVGGYGPESQSVREGIEEQLVRLNRCRERITHLSSGGGQVAGPPRVAVEVPDLRDQMTNNGQDIPDPVRVEPRPLPKAPGQCVDDVPAGAGGVRDVLDL